MGPRRAHGGGHARMAMQGVGGDDAALQHQALQRRQRGRDLVAAFGPSGRDRQPCLGVPDAHHERRHEGAAPLVAAPQALAVDGHDPLGRADPQPLAQGRGKAGQSSGEFLRVEEPEHPAEAVMARRSVRQIDDLAQSIHMRIGKIRNLHATLRPAQCRRQRNKQHRPKNMPGIDVARILNVAENRDNRLHRRPPQNKEAPSESNFSIPATELYSSAIPLPLRGARGSSCPSTALRRGRGRGPIAQAMGRVRV